MQVPVLASQRPLDVHGWRQIAGSGVVNVVVKESPERLVKAIVSEVAAEAFQENLEMASKTRTAVKT